MKKVLLIFALFLILAFGMVMTQNYLKTNNLFPSNNSPLITINDHTFKLRIADSPKEKEIGLSETKLLPENEGMLFTFEKPDYYSFWMRNMKIPIDMIYIANQEIVTIYNNIKPPTNSSGNLTIYTPTEPSDKVLEIQAGLSEKYKFKNGDKVKYENLSD
ncbi:MAG: DUF192 domain-containing protein [Candidatus Levybacteria bacterium]|nr:DUF192 domain-containing protein [Candidatus Levybacteria bacterium]